jgi:hypothetical protein
MNREELKKIFTYCHDSGDLSWIYQPEKPKDWNGRMAGRKLGGKSTGGNNGKKSFKSCQVMGKDYKVSHLVWLWHGNCIPEGKILVLIDGDGMNTRIENILLADRSAAQSSRSSVGKTGYKGVYKHKNGFKAEITIQGSRMYLGFFNTAIEAADMYDFAAFQANENAKLNSQISRDVF